MRVPLQPIWLLFFLAHLLSTADGSYWKASKNAASKEEGVEEVGLAERGFRKLLDGEAPKRKKFSMKMCMAEEECVSDYCGKGYEHTAIKFPYNITYAKTVEDGATSFTFTVCNKLCDSTQQFCEPLLSWSIRLDSDLVSHPALIRDTVPDGTLIDQCMETGKGMKWQELQLGALYDHLPWSGESCQAFILTVAHDNQMSGSYWLTDICQQKINVVATKNGKPMFGQSSMRLAKEKFSDVGSCLLHYRTRSGIYGFTLLEDREFTERDVRNHDLLLGLDGNMAAGGAVA